MADCRELSRSCQPDPEIHKIMSSLEFRAKCGLGCDDEELLPVNFSYAFVPAEKHSLTILVQLLGMVAEIANAPRFLEIMGGTLFIMLSLRAILLCSDKLSEGLLVKRLNIVEH